jgi:hypothetical protein
LKGKKVSILNESSQTKRKALYQILHPNSVFDVANRSSWNFTGLMSAQAHTNSVPFRRLAVSCRFQGVNFTSHK